MTTDNKECFGEAFNVGNGKNISVLELYNLIRDLLNSQIEPIFGPVRSGDVPHTLADINKGKNLLGFTPSMP